MSPLRAVVGAGPRAAEEALLTELERLAPRAAGDLGGWPGPVRVVVPSGSLRGHLMATLARRRPAWLGVEVLTLRRVALSIFERAGAPVPRGEALLPVLVRRAAQAEPLLAGPLQTLEGGFAPLVASVRDLLDAGLDAVHGSPMTELLRSDGVRIAFAERPRAEAVVRVAERTARELERWDGAAGAAIYRRAADLAGSDAASVPPARAWLLYGFADATGSVVDLLEALGRADSETLLVVDLPESATGAPRDPGEPFGAAVRGRLLGGRSLPAPRVLPRAELDAFSALGERGEVGEVVRRAGSELATRPDLRPESIGIVARDLAPYLPALRRELERAGLPFSVEGAGAADPVQRTVSAAIRLLDRGVATEADLILDLVGAALEPPASEADLRVALRRLAVGSLGALAELGEAQLPPVELPSRAVENEGNGEPRIRRRWLPRPTLAALVGLAVRLRRALERLPARGSAESLVRGLALLAHRGLPPGSVASAWLSGVAGRLSAELPREFHLGRDELAELVARAAEREAPMRLGGVGGGIQVLTVTAARGRTFERLFLIGLRRGLFPRPVGDDPILPDAVRREARQVLPDLPVKSEGHAEERFLFDQLLAAAPRSTLSFPAVSDDGSTRLLSPLVDRLSWRDERTRTLREQLRSPLPAAPPRDRPGSPEAAARAAGLARDRRAWLRILPAAIAEARAASQVEESDRRLARFRAAVVAELDPDPRSAEGKRRWSSLGPYFGRVGPPAAERLFVTQVEALVRCPWQVFLGRRLGLEPLPDPGQALPEPLDALRVGQASHDLLERLVRRRLPAASPRELAAALAAGGVEVAFPEPLEIALLAREVATEALADAGLSRWGFESLLAEALVERAEAARDDWGTGARRVVGVELEGEADLAPWGVPLRLGFRADRVDYERDRVVLTDYKTGAARGLSRFAKKEQLTAAVATGRWLQPAVYVAALAGAAATGRLLALGPADDPGAPRVAALDETASGALTGLARVTAIAAAARGAGRALPRLVDPSGDQRGPACDSCELVEACLQEDSGARRRLARWAADLRAARRAPAGAAARAEAELFLLPEGESDTA